MSVLNPGDDELLDGVEADGVEPDGFERRANDDGLGKDLRQPQHLDELAFAALAHAAFQKPTQMLKRPRQGPALAVRQWPAGARQAFDRRGQGCLRRFSGA